MGSVDAEGGVSAVGPAPGFMNPEGIVLYHAGSQQCSRIAETRDLYAVASAVVKLVREVA